MSSSHRKLPKLVVLLGPTASGKTDWSLDLAQAFDGEIISADSRQIYKKMDIGTAKPAGQWRRVGLRKTFCVDNIPHHLVDFLDPGKTFSAAEFRDQAIKYTKLVYAHKHVPMLVGGTGLYIAAVVDNFKMPRVPANKKMRKSLEQKTDRELMDLLKNLDPDTAMIIDQKNKRRIIRALEVSIFTGEPFSKQRTKGEPLFDVIQIGIQASRETLYERIDRRVEAMMKAGLLQEVERLVKQKYSWELSSMNGVGYRQFRDYFDGRISLADTVERLKRDTRRYARRQLTWFKRDKRIHWVKTLEEARDLVRGFLGE